MQKSDMFLTREVSDEKNQTSEESPVIRKFLRYVKIDTQSSEESDTFPSTAKQKDLARLLKQELLEMGADSVWMDEKYGYVYAAVPANDDGKKKEVLGFISHMDTSPETSGKDVRAKIVGPYEGGDIVLNAEKGYVLSPSDYPEMLSYMGQHLIVTDGTTLLGADDKAGIAEIMAMAEALLKHPERKHGRIVLCFTPDEEIGAGVDHIDLVRLGADAAYTVDGGGIGELEYENFNAAALKVKVHGLTVHPGEAKNKMKNAARIAMEYDRRIPEAMRPEYTEGYEGFFHLCEMSGTTEEAELHYIIRDHDRVLFEKKKKLAESIAAQLNEIYGDNCVTAEIHDSYYNMKEKIDPGHMDLIENAEKAMKGLGIVPRIQPIRGGTDGARLSFMGLPCPNLCTGGHNYHGRYEYVCLESMEKTEQLLEALACME